MSGNQQGNHVDPQRDIDNGRSGQTEAYLLGMSPVGIRGASAPKHSPASTTSGPDSSSNPTTENPRDSRSQRACETCRGLKIRCIVDENSPDNTCRKCLKNKQQCVFLPINRKRKRRADTRVGELEKKMEDLIGALQASKKRNSSPQRGSLPTLSVLDDRNSLRVVDIIDTGAMTSKTAYDLFNFYNSEMTECLPFVILGKHETAEVVRKERPLLFLAIIQAAAQDNLPEMAVYLKRQLWAILANRLISTGCPSIEVLESLLTTASFYVHSGADDRNFNHLIHAVPTMAMDAGLGRRIGPKYLRMFRDPSEDKILKMDPNSTRMRRIWVGAYISCVTVATVMRRQLLLQWNAYMDESLEILSSAPDVLPSDKWLCHIVRAQHIAEEVHRRFSMDDPMATIPVADWSIQLRGFDAQIQKWREGITADMPQDLARIIDARLTLFAHEIAMHQGPDQDDFRPPFSIAEEAPRFDIQAALDTPAHISSLTVCLRAMHQMFDTILALKHDECRKLPTQIFVFLASGLTALLKMSSIVEAPGSELRSIFGRQDLQVETYLDRLANYLEEVSMDGKLERSGRFWEITVMMRVWWSKKREQPPTDRSAVAGNMSAATALPGTASTTSIAATLPQTDFSASPELLTSASAGPAMIQASAMPSSVGSSTSIENMHDEGLPSYDGIDLAMGNVDFLSQFDNGFDWPFWGGLTNPFAQTAHDYAQHHLGDYSMSG